MSEKKFNLKDFEYTYDVRIKLYDDTEFICDVSDVSDAEDNDIPEMDMGVDVTKVLHLSPDEKYLECLTPHIRKGSSNTIWESLILEIEKVKKD